MLSVLRFNRYEEIAGQEDADRETGLEYDDEYVMGAKGHVRITPFNMREELEEGAHADHLFHILYSYILKFMYCMYSSQREELTTTVFRQLCAMFAGHFDRAGTYIFNGRRGLVRDNWLDNVDWISIKTSKPGAAAAASDSTAGAAGASATAGATAEQSSSDVSASESANLSPEELYERIYTMLQPGETVLQVIRDAL